jgi:hypothetical protein
MAPAVVNEPAGSAKIDSAKGGKSASLAAFSMASASTAFFPPMKRPVRRASFGGREKIASCTSALISATSTLE